MSIQSIYRALMNQKCRNLVALYNFKYELGERVAILHKRKLYKDVIWSPEQQKTFDSYWLKYYGKKIPNWWHRLYQRYTGSFNVRYIPEMLYSTRIEPAWNPYLTARGFENKAIVESLASGLKNEVRVPKSYVICDEGILYGAQRCVCSRKDVLHTLYSIGSCVIKPTKDTGSGKGVCFMDIHEGIDKRTGKQIEELLVAAGKNYILQERLRMSADLERLYPNAVNTFRIMTYIVDDRVTHAPVALRIGSNGGELDNIHAGGIGIYIHDDGTLSDTAFQLGFGDKDIRFERHPNTGVIFKGYQIKATPNVIRAAEELHGHYPGLRIISWDFTLDEQNIPVLIEANILGQGSWFPQTVSGEGLFGENTERVLQEFRE